MDRRTLSSQVRREDGSRSGMKEPSTPRHTRAGTPDSAVGLDYYDPTLVPNPHLVAKLDNLLRQVVAIEAKLDRVHTRLDQVLMVLGPQLHTVRHYKTHYENLEIGP